MRYMRITARHTWTDYKRNTGFAKELNMTPVLAKMKGYRTNWLQHIHRMQTYTQKAPLIDYREN